MSAGRWAGSGSTGASRATFTAVGSRHFYEPRRGHRLPHDPFKAIIAPRPVGWVSSRSAEGVLNLAPYSFFNAFTAAPPIIGFASNGWKDSVANIEASGEFCWHLADHGLAARMNLTSASLPPEVDEFAAAGLTPRRSQVVEVPHAAEARVVFECRRTQIVRLTDSHGTEVDTWLTLGEVVGVHIDESLLVDGIYDTAAGDPVLRAGGPSDYFRIGTDRLFRMRRPRAEDVDVDR